jgi:hypothetical protein
MGKEKSGERRRIRPASFGSRLSDRNKKGRLPVQRNQRSIQSCQSALSPESQFYQPGIRDLFGPLQQYMGNFQIRKALIPELVLGQSLYGSKCAPRRARGLILRHQHMHAQECPLGNGAGRKFMRGQLPFSDAPVVFVSVNHQSGECVAIEELGHGLSAA